MAQLKINVTGVSSKEDGDRLAAQTASVAGVRFVNVNHEEGFVIVTHGDGFDEAAFKAAVAAAGFSA